MVFSVEILVDGKEVFHVNNKSPPNYFERYKDEKITQIKYMDPIKYDYPKNYRCPMGHIMQKCFTKVKGTGPIKCDGC